MRRSLFVTKVMLVVVAAMSAFLVLSAAQAEPIGNVWDLATDWTLTTPSGLCQFGANNAWNGFWGGVDYYDLAHSFTQSDPWPDPYNITGTTEVETTRDITRGTTAGGQDQLTFTPVVDILEVKQGTTVFVKGVDWQQSGDYVDWLGSGNEPAAGTTYTVRWKYTANVGAGIYNIDFWTKAGSSGVPNMPLLAKNVGGGNIPGTVNGVVYDWPVGKVAGSTHPASKYRSQPYIYWKAPADMTISVYAAIWIPIRYPDHATRRVMWVLMHDHASNGYQWWGGDPLGWSRGVLVPLWYGDGIVATGDDPFTLDEMISGPWSGWPPLSWLRHVPVHKDDIIISYCYWDETVTTDVGTCGIDLTIYNDAATPTFFPPGGKYFEAQQVTISTIVSGATVYYTTDGTDPSPTNGTPYSGAVTVDHTLTLKARAYSGGQVASDVGTANYVIEPLGTDWDLARDFTIAENGFGANKCWTLFVNGTQPYDIPKQFTAGDPWVDNFGGHYNIDGWSKTGWMSQPYMPMFGKNVGGGNIPDDTYDWPNGKVATYIVDGNSYVQWEAPTDMVVNVTGGIWTAGRYFDVDSRRSLLTLLIDRADNGYDPFVSPDWIKPNTTVPLWYDDGSGITATAADQHTFAEIMGPDAGMFQGLQVTRGDRIAAYFYSDPSAFAEGLNGMDFVITGSALTAPPSFSPDGGLYFAPQNVAMSSSTPGATIRYTTDGSDPSPTHGTVYSSAVLVSASMTLKAIAYTGTGESTIKSADYVIAIPTSVTIGEAKSLSDMSAADLSSVVVSASFADRWYVQSLDRSAGIMVSGPIPGGFSVGSVADIRGLLKTDTDTAERYVQPVEVTDTTNKADVWPLIVTNKTLGGGPMGLQAGVNGGSGLNNIGTPVKTTGRVTLVETDHFVLDDGSGVNVKVIGSPPVAENSYITVTGISSCEKDGSGNVLRLIRATDFLPVKPAIAYSTHLGGKQIWIRASSFVRRSADGGSPNFVEDPIAVPNTKSGAAFYFKRQVTSSALEQLDWWVQYDIPQMGEFGAPFDLNGTWRFWARTSQNSWNANDADWVVVNGDPNDLSKSSPTNADWFNALWVNKDNARANSTQRVLNNIANAGFTAYTFGWFSSENLSTARAKAFGVIDDKVSFRLYEREASFTNALIDVICWSSDPTYVPSDGDLDAVTGW